MLVTTLALSVTMVWIFALESIQLKSALAYEKKSSQAQEASKTSSIFSTNNINIREYPVKKCPAIKDTPEADRPILEYQRTIWIYDSNEDGVINEKDMQFALDIAEKRHETSWDFYRVILDKNQDRYYIDGPIYIGSGVYFDGLGKIILASKSFNSRYMIHFKADSFISWIHNTKIITKYKAKAGAISIEDGARSVFIYDSVFMDEIADGSKRRDKEGSGTAITMIRAWDNVRSVFIDWNFFLHVPTGITLAKENITNINIKHNTFTKWRQRAIYLRNSDGVPITDIRISHNRINPPKTWAVRQPIAAQTLSEDIAFERINFTYNNVFSPDLPHIWEYRQREDGSTYKYTMLNNATADAISLHNADGFQIVWNCVINSWETGIAVARKAKNGTVRGNFILGSDTWAIGIWAVPQQAHLKTENISVVKNTIINPSMNRANTLPAWARSAIGFTSTDKSYYNNNRIIETNTLYDDNGKSQNMMYAIYEYNAVNTSSWTLNTLDAPEHVQWNWSRTR